MCVLMFTICLMLISSPIIYGQKQKSNENKNYGIIMGYVNAYAEADIAESLQDAKNKNGGDYANMISKNDLNFEMKTINVKVCAIDARDTTVKYCTMSKGRKYKLKVPPGIYYVYAEYVPDTYLSDQYYTDNVLCKLHNDCFEISNDKSVLLKVKVLANKVTDNIDPIDDFWKELLMIREDSIIIFRRK